MQSREILISASSHLITLFTPDRAGDAMLVRPRKVTGGQLAAGIAPPNNGDWKEGRTFEGAAVWMATPAGGKSTLVVATLAMNRDGSPISRREHPANISRAVVSVGDNGPLVNHTAGREAIITNALAHLTGLPMEDIFTSEPAGEFFEKMNKVGTSFEAREIVAAFDELGITV